MFGGPSAQKRKRTPSKKLEEAASAADEIAGATREKPPRKPVRQPVREETPPPITFAGTRGLSAGKGPLKLCGKGVRLCSHPRCVEVLTEDERSKHRTFNAKTGEFFFSVFKIRGLQSTMQFSTLQYTFLLLTTCSLFSNLQACTCPRRTQTARATDTRHIPTQ